MSIERRLSEAERKAATRAVTITCPHCGKSIDRTSTATIAGKPFDYEAFQELYRGLATGGQEVVVKVLRGVSMKDI